MSHYEWFVRELYAGRRLKSMTGNWVYNNRCQTKETLLTMLRAQYDEYRERQLLHAIFPTPAHYYKTLLRVLKSIPMDCRKEGTRILDIGCGEGQLLGVLKNLGFDVSGVDKQVFDGLNTQGQPRGPLLMKFFHEKDIFVKQIDVQIDKLLFPEEYFDLITIVKVLERVHFSPHHMMTEAKRVLRRGGYILIESPNYASVSKRINAIRGRSNHAEDIHDFYYQSEKCFTADGTFIGHVREYTTLELKQMLMWEGF